MTVTAEVFGLMMTHYALASMGKRDDNVYAAASLLWWQERATK